MRFLDWLKTLFVEFLQYMTEPLPLDAYPVACDTPEQAFFCLTKDEAEMTAAEYNGIVGTETALPVIYINDDGEQGYVVRIFGETPERTIGYVRYV